MNRTIEIQNKWREYHQLSVKINDLKHLHRTMWPKKPVFCQKCFSLDEWKPGQICKSRCCGERLVGLAEAVELLTQQKSDTMDRIAELYGEEEM